MATTQRITRVVGNRGRAFGSPSHKKKSYKARKNTGEILAYSLSTGNPGARKGNMATKKNKKKSYSHKKPGSRSYKTKHNTGRKNYGGHAHHKPAQKHYKRRGRGNPGTGSIGEVITTSTFVLVGALGSKLGAQLVLGSNNTGVVGYAGNLAIGGLLWFAADKVMKNKTAANGIIAGTVAQLILRLINDFTPFGQYVSGFGMGDYQMQSYVTPQILMDPTHNSDLLIPNGWGAPALPAPASPATMGKRGGMSGTYDMDQGGVFSHSTY